MFKAFLIVMVLGAEKPLVLKDVRALSSTKVACVLRYEEMKRAIIKTNLPIVKLKGFCMTLPQA